MYSEIVDGKVLDFKFEKRKIDTVFRVGDICVGQLFKRPRGGWSAVSVFKNPYGPVHGFITRLDAAEYLLAVFRKERLGVTHVTDSKPFKPVKPAEAGLPTP